MLITVVGTAAINGLEYATNVLLVGIKTKIKSIHTFALSLSSFTSCTANTCLLVIKMSNQLRIQNIGNRQMDRQLHVISELLPR